MQDKITIFQHVYLDLPTRIRFQPSSSILKAQTQKDKMWVRFSLEQIQLKCMSLPTKELIPLSTAFQGYTVHYN